MYIFGVGMHLPGHICGGQGRALSVSCYLSPCLRWPFILFSRLADWWASGDTLPPVSTLHFVAGALGWQICTPASSFSWVLGIWTLMCKHAQENALPTESSPWPCFFKNTFHQLSYITVLSWMSLDDFNESIKMIQSLPFMCYVHCMNRFFPILTNTKLAS